MTNCPNCGAPYKLDSPVCEYCGTPREKLPDEIRMEQELEQVRMDVEQAKHEFLTLRLQAAQQAQHNHITANAGMVFMGNVNNVKNIQVTRKAVTPEPEGDVEKVTLKEWLNVLSIPVISLILFGGGLFGMSHTEGAISCIFNMLLLCGTFGCACCCLVLSVSILIAIFGDETPQRSLK